MDTSTRWKSSQGWLLQNDRPGKPAQTRRVTPSGHLSMDSDLGPQVGFLRACHEIPTWRVNTGIDKNKSTLTSKRDSIATSVSDAKCWSRQDPQPPRNIAVYTSVKGKFFFRCRDWAKAPFSHVGVSGVHFPWWRFDHIVYAEDHFCCLSR
jgi:hypothetical protein